MSTKGPVAPSTLEVELLDDGIAVRYLDGREVFYHGPPEAIGSSVRTRPGKNVHVLVTAPDGVEGVLVYVDERRTADEILESTGVGRVLLDDDESAEPFPGVTAAREGYAVTVGADPAVVDGRVFVFAEDEFGERAYELLATADEEAPAAGAGSDGGSR